MILVTTLLHPTQQSYSAGMHEVEKKRALLHGHNFLVRKLEQLKVEKPERNGKITNNE